MIHEMDLKTLTLLSYTWSLGCVENGAPSCNGTMVLDSLISLGWANVCKAILVSESTTCQFGSSGSGGGSAMATPVEFRRFSKVDPACTSFTMVVVMFCNSSVDRSPALAVVLSSGHRKIKHEKIQISVIKFYIFNPFEYMCTTPSSNAVCPFIFHFFVSFAMTHKYTKLKVCSILYATRNNALYK